MKLKKGEKKTENVLLCSRKQFSRDFICGAAKQKVLFTQEA